MIRRRAYIQRYVPLRRAKGNKFGAKPIHDVRTGESWDSTGEHRMWGILKIRERAGEISDLMLHPRVVLLPRDGKCQEIAFKPDYSYTEAGRTVYVDYKPRPQTARETLMFKLWQRFGPGPLIIMGKRGETKKHINGKGEA